MNAPISFFWAATLMIAVAVLLGDYTWLQGKLLEYDFDTKYSVQALESGTQLTAFDINKTVGVWRCKDGVCMEPFLEVDSDNFLKHYNVSTYTSEQSKIPIGKGIILSDTLKYSEGDPESSYIILSLTRNEMILKNESPHVQHPVGVFTRVKSEF